MPVNVRLPHVQSGGDGTERDDAGLCALESSDDGEWDASDSDARSEQTHTSAAERVAEVAGAAQPYADVDAISAPVSLDGPLLTLSGQPASKWESLVHLDAIKARLADALNLSCRARAQCARTTRATVAR